MRPGREAFVSLLTTLASHGVIKSVGLDFAETWGVLTLDRNFIPSIGFILAVAPAAAMALVQFGGTFPFLFILVGLGMVQMVPGNVMVTAMTGRSLNFPSVMVILSLTAWTGIWGLPEARLSVPLTVCKLLFLAELPTGWWIAVLLSMGGRG